MTKCVGAQETGVSCRACLARNVGGQCQTAAIAIPHSTAPQRVGFSGGGLFGRWDFFGNTIMASFCREIIKVFYGLTYNIVFYFVYYFIYYYYVINLLLNQKTSHSYVRWAAFYRHCKPIGLGWNWTSKLELIDQHLGPRGPKSRLKSCNKKLLI